MTTSDLLTHPWILDNNTKGATQQKFKLTLRELLAVSSDWKDVNKTKGNAGGYQGSSSSNLPADFQSQQIDRIVEAIALTLPSLGGGNGTLTTSGGSELASVSSANSIRFDDNCVRDLAFDLGVDARSLKGKLSSIFAGGPPDQQQIEKIQSMHFNM